MLEGVLSTVQHNECSYGFSAVCDRIENSDRAGSDWDHFGRNRTGLRARKSLPDSTGLTGFFKLQHLTYNRKHKYGSLDFEIWVEGEGQDTSRHLRLVLGPCAQCCPCKASEQKMGPKTKI